MSIESLISTVLSEHYEGRLDAIVSGFSEGSGVFGQFIGDGRVYDYYATPQKTAYQLNRQDTDSLNEYAHTWMELQGIYCDSAEPYEFLRGRFNSDSIREDSQVFAVPRYGAIARFDGAAVVCKKGGTPCGKRCLPKGQKCRQNSNQAGVAVKNASGEGKKGGFARKLGKAALIGAGVVGGAKLAGKGLEEAALELGSRKHAEDYDLDKKEVKEGMRDLLEGSKEDLKLKAQWVRMAAGKIKDESMTVVPSEKRKARKKKKEEEYMRREKENDKRIVRGLKKVSGEYIA